MAYAYVKNSGMGVNATPVPVVPSSPSVVQVRPSTSVSRAPVSIADFPALSQVAPASMTDEQLTSECTQLQGVFNNVHYRMADREGVSDVAVAYRALVARKDAVCSEKNNRETRARMIESLITVGAVGTVLGGAGGWFLGKNALKSAAVGGGAVLAVYYILVWRRQMSSLLMVPRY